MHLIYLFCTAKSDLIRIACPRLEPGFSVLFLIIWSVMTEVVRIFRAIPGLDFGFL